MPVTDKRKRKISHESNDVSKRMSTKQDATAETAQTGVPVGGSSAETRTERIARYKRQRREELSLKYGTGAAASGTAAAAAKPKGDAKAPVSDRRQSVPNVRMTKAARLRALQNSTVAHAAMGREDTIAPQSRRIASKTPCSSESQAKGEPSSRQPTQERLGWKPLDVNDNVSGSKQAANRGNRLENGTGHQLTVTDKSCKRKSSFNGMAGHPPGASTSLHSCAEKKEPPTPPRVRHFERTAIGRGSQRGALRPPEVCRRSSSPEVSKQSSASVTVVPPSPKDCHSSATCEPAAADKPVAVYSVTIHTTSTSFVQAAKEPSPTPLETPAPEQTPARLEERKTSFVEAVHGILKTREDDSADERRPIHSILKKTEERSGSSGLHSILKRSGSEEEPSGVEVQSILKCKADDAPRPPSGPKPILKKHEDAGTRIEPKPILKRKSVDGEEKPKPILKTQQRRWSHDHDSASSDGDVIVRRRSRSTELESQPVLRFPQDFRGLPTRNLAGGDAPLVLPLPPQLRRRSLSDSKAGDGDGQTFGLEGEKGSSEERELQTVVVSAVNETLVNRFQKSGSRTEQHKHDHRQECCDPPQAFSPLLKRVPEPVEQCYCSSVKVSLVPSVRKESPAPKEAAETKKFPDQYSAAQSAVNQRIRRRTQPVTAGEILAATKMETAREGTDATEDELSKLSVADKVSLFKKSTCPERPEAPVQKTRYSAAARRSLPRFQTQPVTTEEVQKATREAEASTKEKSEEGDDLSRMSLAEKLRMFNQKVTVDMLAQRPVVRSQSTRRATEDTALPPGRPRSQTSPTPEVARSGEQGSTTVAKGILKTQAAQKTPIKGILKTEHTEHHEAKEEVRGILKPDHDVGRASPVKPILKTKQKSPSKSSSEESSSSSSSESESSEENGKTDTRKILAPGQKHLIVRSPVPQKKQISNPAVQRMLKASLRKKGEDEGRSMQVLSSESRLRSLSANAGDAVDPDRLYARQSNQTQPITVDEWKSCSGSIAQRLEALRKSEEEWRSRLKKDDETSTDLGASKSVSELRKDAKVIEVHKSPSIGDRKTWLETSSESWRQRVQGSDAAQFTVAGKMGCAEPSVKELLLTERKRRAPRPDTFSSPQPEVLKRIQQRGTQVLPSLLKSKSVPNAVAEELRSRARREEKEERARVLIPKADNETFTSFFESLVPAASQQESRVEISESAFDEVVSSNIKLAQRKQVSVRRKQQTKGNPLRALASRSDLHQEYLDMHSDVVERELQRMNVEKLAKTSDLAISALAGLASTEDFRSVQLKKRDEMNSSGLLPNRDLALIQVKGRRHVQTRLVEPSVSSVNHGDVFILVTPSTIYCWIGRHSNVIERAKASDVATSIHAKKDLHFKGTAEVKVIDGEKDGNSADEQTFFKLLGGSVEECKPAGSPGEDLRYEAAIIDTNMIYRVEGEALVPYEQYWGMQPRFEMLEPDKALVFNFGSELYVWLGKQVPAEQRVLAVRLAEERSKEGFDYSECDIDPLHPKVGGMTESFSSSSGESNERPNWTLFAKVNQNMEPVLFREKFLDWPDTTKLIRVKEQAQEESRTAASESGLKPCDAKTLLNRTPEEPDLELSGSHLGRGREYYDPLERRRYEISTVGIKMWHTTEYEHRAIPEDSYGQFYSGDTYVIRWQYVVTQTGRDLSGQKSRHTATGRERCAYFFWQGKDSTVTEQGACARLTVELDEERGPHVRVLEGKEPPCFLNLFDGKMVVHRGKRGVPNSRTGWQMYMVRGESPHEAALVEVSPAGAQNLRSRTSFVVLHSKTNKGVSTLYLWHGAWSAPHVRKAADYAVDKLLEKWPEEMGPLEEEEPDFVELEEGAESKEFWEGLGGDQKRKQHLFHSLLDSKVQYDFTPRLFHATAVSKTFEMHEVLCPWRRTDVSCAYPFLQSDLYGAPQPAVFLFDNKHEMYVWQGWWPQDLQDDGIAPASSEKVRWNTVRRLTMETALHYAQEANPSDPPKVYLVFAGLEPMEFASLFPTWEDDDRIAQVLMKEGKSQGEKRSVQETLAELTKTHYPLEELRREPLPEGIDPSRLEAYLSDDEFETLFGCSKAKFYELPVWKQNKQKEQVGLF